MSRRINSNMVSSAIILGTLLTLSSLSTANAAVISLNDTVNISGFSQTPTSFQQVFTPYSSGPVAISAGDSIDQTVNFAGGLALSFTNSGNLLAYNDNASTSNSFTIQNIQLTLLGFSGTGGALSTHSIGSVSSGSAHIGAAFNNLVTLGQSLTFTGYHVTYDVTSMSAGTVTYGSVWTIAQNGAQTNVPEPASLALLALGLAGLGFSRRKTKKAA